MRLEYICYSNQASGQDMWRALRDFVDICLYLLRDLRNRDAE